MGQTLPERFPEVFLEAGAGCGEKTHRERIKKRRIKDENQTRYFEPDVHG
jgi:hypothetical protein